MVQKQNTGNTNKVPSQREPKRQTILTAYGAAKLVNEALKEEGIKKRIPPQMMYNYTHARVRENKRPLIEYSKKDGIDRTAFDKWLAEYIEKQKEA